jgi:hypothetical protein
MARNFTFEQNASGANNALSGLATFPVSIADAKHDVYARTCVVVATQALLAGRALELGKYYAFAPTDFPRNRVGLVDDLSDIDVYCRWLDQAGWNESAYRPILESRGFSGTPYDGMASVEDIVRLELLAKSVLVMARTLFVETKLRILLADVLRRLRPELEWNGYEEIKPDDYAAWREGTPVIDEQDMKLRMKAIRDLDLSAFEESDAVLLRSRAIAVVQLHSLHSCFSQE